MEIWMEKGDSEEERERGATGEMREIRRGRGTVVFLDAEECPWDETIANAI